MANALNLFDSRRSDWCIPGTGKLTPEAQRFVRDLWIRAGGAIGASSGDLSAAQFEDAGIEEIRSTMFAGLDALGQAPTIPEAAADPLGFALTPPLSLEQQVEYLESRTAELGAQMAEMLKEIQALKEAP